ncbi:MAG: prolyl oligopeptidase family serine peptidase [Bythopirellula sp.]
MKSTPPATRIDQVSDTYHGFSVTDNYRWLEDGSDPAVEAWSDTQNHYARSILDKLPNVHSIRRRVTEILSAETTSYDSVVFYNGTYFATKNEPPKEQPVLIAFDSLTHPEQASVVYDPEKIDESSSKSMDWFKPSPDGSLIAISVSSGGTEIGDVSIFETKSGNQVFETVPHVNSGTAGGDLAWDADGQGFYYTRHFNHDENQQLHLEVYQQLYFHRLGTDIENDRYELGKGFPTIAEITVDVHHSTGQVLCNVAYGDGGEFAHFLRSPNGTWHQFSEFGDKLVQTVFEPSGSVLAITREGASRGKLVRLQNIGTDAATESLLIPECSDTIATNFFPEEVVLLATENRIYVTYQLGGPAELRVFDHAGNPVAQLQPVELSCVGCLTQLDGDAILFRGRSFAGPAVWYQVKESARSIEQTKISSTSLVAFDDVEVSREFAISKDGTKIPMNIMRPASARGPGPLVLFGYGGYGSNITPHFKPANKVLFEQGVTYVVANIRGGGEYGERWHLEGNLTHKQNIFDDFYATAKYLIDNNYTTPDQLAFYGRSNGGILMGAMLTQHPELMKCVVSQVGIYDMLRVELSPNGKFNIPEFGTVEDPDQFEALYSYSPFHNIEPGVDYPATLLTTGKNDPRVDSMQSRKMTARLQSASSSEAPILLRTNANAGHGHHGTALSLQIEESVDVLAFLLHHLGVDYQEATSRKIQFRASERDGHKPHTIPARVKES